MIKKFSEEFEGYNKKEVNEFLDAVIKNTEILVDKNNFLSHRVERLEEDILAYQKKELSLSEALVKATELANTIKENALRERELIIEQAKDYSEKIVNNSLMKSERIDMNRLRMERNIITYKKKLERIVEEQLELIKRIDEIKFED